MKRIFITLIFFLGLCVPATNAGGESSTNSIMVLKRNLNNRPNKPAAPTNDVVVVIYDGEVYISFVENEGMAVVEVYNDNMVSVAKTFASTKDIIILPMDTIKPGDYTLTIETEAGSLYEGQFYL